MSAGLTVLGSGMGGIGAASHARAHGVEHVVFEAKAYAGGHTTTHVRDGFVFDEGPHVSFTKNERIKSVVRGSDRQQVRVDRCVHRQLLAGSLDSPSGGHQHARPASPPRDRRHPRLRRSRNRTRIRSSATTKTGWWRVTAGRTPKLFRCATRVKYHTTPASNMSTEWVGPRLYQAKLDEVLLRRPVRRAAEHSLRAGLPLSHARRLRGVPERAAAPIEHRRSTIKVVADRSARPRVAVREWQDRRLRAARFLDAAARPDPDDPWRAGGRARSGRARSPARRSCSSISGSIVRTSPGRAGPTTTTTSFRSAASATRATYSPHVVPAGHGQHPGRGVLLEEVQASDAAGRRRASIP